MDVEVWPAVLAGLIAGAIMEGPVYGQKALGLPVKQNIFRTWGNLFGLRGPAGYLVGGGWWVLGLRDPVQAEALIGVPMSSPSTYAATREALERSGLTVGAAAVLRDVDEVDDAEAVAAGAPDSEFARVWTASRVRA